MQKNKVGVTQGIIASGNTKSIKTKSLKLLFAVVLLVSLVPGTAVWATEPNQEKAAEDAVELSGDQGGESESIPDEASDGDEPDQAAVDPSDEAEEATQVVDSEQITSEQDTGDAGNLSRGASTLGNSIRSPRAPSGSANDAPQYGQISLVKFKRIANGAMGGMALDTSGAVWVWGYNLYGQLGIGKTNSEQSYYGGMKRVPYFAQNGITIVEIGSSYETRYALGSNGKVYAWGHGTSGAMGNGTSTATNTTPQEVPGLSNVEHLFVSDSYLGEASVIVQTSDGKLYGWGDNGSNLLGVTGNTTTPREIPLDASFSNGERTVVKVAIGSRSAFILDNQGDLWSSGQDSSGEMGNGTSNNGYSVFTKMAKPADMGVVIDVDVSYSRLQNISDRIAAVDANGNAWEWGTTFGDGTSAALRITKEVPQKIVLDPAGVANIGYTPVPQSIVSSEMICYFIDQYGRPWGWGSGYYFGFGREGGYEDSNDQLIKSTAAQQVPKIVGDGDTQIYDSGQKLPVYSGGGRTASGRFGYGFNDLHPTIYDEKYMLKDAQGNVLDAEGKTLKYASGTVVDGVTGLTTGKYYRTTADGKISSSKIEGTPAIDPNDWTWIRLAFQPVPYIAQMDMTLSAYAFLDADGNLFKWGNDGSGAVAWGWDYETKYDQNGSLNAGLYDRYTYEVMYMRGAPTIDNISLSANIDKKVYKEANGSVTNPVDITVHVPSSGYNDALEATVHSDLKELKYVFIPYDSNNANFNLNTATLTREEFMALYDAADTSKKGELLTGDIPSSDQVQDIAYQVNASENGRYIIYGANERYAAGSGGSQNYLNEDPLFISVLVDNVYTPVAANHKGEGKNPSGITDTVYGATTDNVVKTNDDSADTGKTFDASLYGMPLDANGQVIGATKDAVTGVVTIGEAPRFGYDTVSVKSYEEAGYPAGSTILNYWQWMDMVEGQQQAKAVSLTMNDVDYTAAGYAHVFFYEPNENWTKVTGTKTWSDSNNQYNFRPSKISLTLKQYERDVTTGAKGDFIQDISTIEVTPDQTGTWSFDFGSSYKSYEYTYEVVETPIPYYTTEIRYQNLVVDPSKTAEDFTGILITNTLDLKPVLFIKADSLGMPIISDTAQFTLTNSVTGEKVFDANGNEQDSITFTTSASDGTLEMPVQKPGVYNLTEVKAPSGFNLLTKPVVITVGSDASIRASLGNIDLQEETLSAEQSNVFAAAFKIVNKIAAELPKAGGIGTLLLLAVSMLFVFAAAFLLRTKRKDNSLPRIS